MSASAPSPFGNMCLGDGRLYLVLKGIASDNTS